jgi:hypothetical protein
LKATNPNGEANTINDAAKCSFGGALVAAGLATHGQHWGGCAEAQKQHIPAGAMTNQAGYQPMYNIAWYLAIFLCSMPVQMTVSNLLNCLAHARAFH